jgi:flagellin-like protein
MRPDAGTDGAQVGIGTLIVFIAMVLVAAIAAGVLIETAGFLQTESEETGEASSAQVTDRVHIVSTTGRLDNELVYEVEIDVTKAPGSGDIDLEEVVIEWIGPDGAYTKTSEDFSIDVISGSGTTLRDRSDRMTLSWSSDVSLDPNEKADVRIITSSGGKATARLRVPPSPDGSDTDL